MEIDPMCGLDLEPLEAAGRMEYNGRVFYFCSKVCRSAFERAPEKYEGLVLEMDGGCV